MAVMTKGEFAQAVGNTTAGDMAMTLVSVDPESLRFVPVASRERWRMAWRSAEKILRRQCSIMSHLQNRVTINWRHRETDAASFIVPDC